MNPDLLRSFSLDPSGPRFEPDRPIEGMEYESIRCPCGSDVFRVTGWPQVVSGPGGFFWRTFVRVWREARQATAQGERIEAPFRLPIETDCPACSRTQPLLDDPGVPGAVPPGERSAPREGYRCRDCRRSLVELVVGIARVGASREVGAVEVVARCRACRQRGRLASSIDQDSVQRARLDLLYGRG